MVCQPPALPNHRHPNQRKTAQSAQQARRRLRNQRQHHQKLHRLRKFRARIHPRRSHFVPQPRTRNQLHTDNRRQHHRRRIRRQIHHRRPQRHHVERIPVQPRQKGLRIGANPYRQRLGQHPNHPQPNRRRQNAGRSPHLRQRSQSRRRVARQRAHRGQHLHHQRNRSRARCVPAIGQRAKLQRARQHV